MEARRFYDDIASLYHLIYANWLASIERQATVLDSILRESLGAGPHRVLDVSCGIGTQTIGLASLGHDVTATDISPASVSRASRELDERGLHAEVSVCDMRQCDLRHGADFDAVLSADNAVPHLLSDEEILTAFRAMRNCTRPRGVALITVRDYAREDRTPVQLRPYGVRVTPDGQCVVFQVWKFDGDYYDVAMYFVQESACGNSEVTISRSRYYAVDTDRLLELMGEAGFADVRRIDERYFQPVLLGRRAV